MSAASVILTTATILLWHNPYCVALIVSVFIIGLLLILIWRSHKKTIRLSSLNKDLTEEIETKEQVISFLSPDISSTSKQRNDLLSELSDQCYFLDNVEEIRKHCSKTLSNVNISNDVASFIIELMVARKQRAESLGISPREIQVIHLCRQGLSSAAIAKKLYISVNTVSTHKRNIYSKLEVSNTAEMIKKSYSLGLL